MGGGAPTRCGHLATRARRDWLAGFVAPPVCVSHHASDPTSAMELVWCVDVGGCVCQESVACLFASFFVLFCCSCYRRGVMGAIRHGGGHSVRPDGTRCRVCSAPLLAPLWRCVRDRRQSWLRLRYVRPAAAAAAPTGGLRRGVPLPLAAVGPPTVGLGTAAPKHCSRTSSPASLHGWVVRQPVGIRWSGGQGTVHRATAVLAHSGGRPAVWHLLCPRLWRHLGCLLPAFCGLDAQSQSGVQCPLCRAGRFPRRRRRRTSAA